MKIRFGMLATDAYGKAGGQCIQRRGSIRVLRNITVPTQRLASTQNPQRFVNNLLFVQFSILSQVVRDSWATVGLALKGVNGWGEEKSYTGREAFLMTNGVLYPYTSSLIDPDVFDYVKPQLSVDGMTLTVGAKTLTISEVIDNNNLMYQMKFLRLRSSAVSPNISKLRTFSRLDALDDTTTNYSKMLALSGPIKVGDVFSIAVRGVSASGLVSLWTQMQVIAKP